MFVDRPRLPVVNIKKILRRKAAEDILKMAGVSGGVEYIEAQTIFQGIR